MMEGSQSSIRVLIVGTSPAGLRNARTLFKDGFEVTMMSKVSSIDKTV